MKFRTEWPQVVEAHTEATLQARLAPLTAQLASELTQSLEARLVEWLDATLEELGIDTETAKERAVAADPFDAYSRLANLSQTLERSIAVSQQMLQTGNFWRMT